MNRLSKYLTALTLLPMALGAAEPDALVGRLEELGRIAAVMVDGDVAQRLITPRAVAKMTVVDPRDRWAGSDNYDVEAAAFLTTKKTLRRLALLVDFPCDVNLWLPAGADGKSIGIAVRNVNELSQFWKWGDLYQSTPPVMRQILDTGQRQTVREKPGWVSVLAPVSNSLGDRVGLVEVVTRLNPDPQESVK